jgi:hypothetical protein
MERSSLVIMAFIGLLGLGCTASRAVGDPAERDAIERGKYIAKASKIAHYANDNDTTLKEAALKLGYVSEAEFDRIVVPSKMVTASIATGGD